MTKELIKFINNSSLTYNSLAQYTTREFNLRTRNYNNLNLHDLCCGGYDEQ